MTDQQHQLPTLTLTYPEGMTVTFPGIDDIRVLRAVQDTTKIEQSWQSFKASGDDVIVLWRRGAARDRVAEALERFEREVTTTDLQPAWMERFR